MEDLLLDLFQSAPYPVSFVAGIITFLSPCVLPLVPAYLSYISGVSIGELRDEEHMSAKVKRKIINSSLLFIAGFSLVFILLGAAAATFLGEILRNQYAAMVAGVIIVIFGLHVMNVINIKFLNYEHRADFTTLEQKAQGKAKSFLHKFAPFLLGLSFALGWTPCVGPILGAILAMASFGDNTAQGTILMTLFAAGLGVPFLLSAILTSRAIGLMNRIKKHFKIVEIVSGLILVAIGIVIATGGLGMMTEALIDIGIQ